MELQRFSSHSARLTRSSSGWRRPLALRNTAPRTAGRPKRAPRPEQRGIRRDRHGEAQSAVPARLDSERISWEPPLSEPLRPFVRIGKVGGDDRQILILRGADHMDRAPAPAGSCGRENRPGNPRPDHRVQSQRGPPLSRSSDRGAPSSSWLKPCGPAPRYQVVGACGRCLGRVHVKHGVRYSLWAPSRRVF